MATAKRSTTATKKTTTTRKTTAPKVTTPTPKVVAGTSVVEQGDKINTNAIIDKVCERLDGKRKDVKPVVEAMLTEMGEALKRGDQLNLQPMGKLMVKREKDAGNARILSCKIRINQDG